MANCCINIILNFLLIPNTQLEYVEVTKHDCTDIQGHKISV